jgi:DNA-directed RNA polymerase specialized sigma24 family protein
MKLLLSALRNVMITLDETRKEFHSKRMKSVRENIAAVLSKYESQINNRKELEMNKENSNRYDGIYDWSRKIIRQRLRPLVGLFGLTWDDLPDLEQDIMLRIFKNIGTYNSEQGSMETFILRIIECKIKDVINHRQAARRDWRQCRDSLNEIIMTDVGPMERLELLQYDNDTGCDLAADIASVVEQLPPDLKELCIILKHYSPSEAIHEYGRSRTVFYKKIKKLRQFFQTAFLKEKFR